MTEPWYRLLVGSADEFILAMLNLGDILEISVVGVLEDSDLPGRGSRRDMDLPLHQDGIRSSALQEAQGGYYIERPGIAYVGLYCLRQGEDSCFTTLSEDGQQVTTQIDLKRGEALVFDNRRLFHGRTGRVGQRLLLRVWVAEREKEQSKEKS